ncbi:MULTISPECIES: C40 family peptidase [Streptomyces]|uniref:C40 family peptidase n=1 Tax=Streptomyces TaxID=1883 RepID=UPI000D508E8E|nr:MULTISPECIES: C40 family peptidase [Streptomyces]MXG24186.1 glycoside hydrolase [Streptomyces sp. YIM 132580]NYS19169.1 glycoside hydrolase [Streptomyces sp. SJ1-7]PVC70151.1 glycoside hydrolase [Streptomyces sp. CS065A]
MNRRHCAAAAITLVCALGLLTVPVQAVAAPAPDTSPSPPASSPSAPSPLPGSSERDLEKVREQIETLYRKAGAATDAYNLAEEQTKKQSGEIVKLAKAIVDGQARIAELKDRAGAQAREQYRNGGLPPGAQLVLSNDPQLFLDGVNKVRTSQQASKTVLAELTRTQEDLETYTQDASSNWHKLETNRVKQAKAKKKINAQIAAAEKLESQLEKKERARLRQLEQDAANRAQSAWLATLPMPNLGAGGATTAAGKAAVAFATAQIGKPYVWGATGPGSYDCSGLTSQAWAAAGRPIPRTSQEQWRLLPRIEIQDMRPGDLIIYHADASHVGMYVGDGAIVHSPRPGRHVTLAGAGSMQILGVVRPDK